MIRNELESFVEKLFTARYQRREFVHQNRRSTKRFLEDAKRDRLGMAKEMQRETNGLRDSLRQSNRKQKTQVARMLHTMQTQRIRQSAQERIVRVGSVARIKRSVERSLRESANDRLRNARNLRREAQSAIRQIRSRVHAVKHASIALTTRVANDLRACRRAWARLREQKMV